MLLAVSRLSAQHDCKIAFRGTRQITICQTTGESDTIRLTLCKNQFWIREITLSLLVRLNPEFDRFIEVTISILLFYRLKSAIFSRKYSIITSLSVFNKLTNTIIAKIISFYQGILFVLLNTIHLFIDVDY